MDFRTNVVRTSVVRTNVSVPSLFMTLEFIELVPGTDTFVLTTLVLTTFVLKSICPKRHLS